MVKSVLVTLFGSLAVFGATPLSVAQSKAPLSVNNGNSTSGIFVALEGKWANFSTSPPTRIEFSVRDGRLQADYVSTKSGTHYSCKNVNYENGLLVFDFPGNPVPTYKLRLAPDGITLTGEKTIPSIPYPIPVTFERVTAWPTPEEIAARGPTGPVIVRK